MLEPEMKLVSLSVRLKKSERADLEKKADRLRCSKSEYIRKILSDREIKQSVIPQINQDTCLQLTRLQVELNRQGNNLNQLIKLLHHQQAPSETIERVATLMEAYKVTKESVDTYQAQLIKLHV